MAAAGAGVRALVIEHERATPGGLVFSWLASHGIEADTFAIDVESREPDPTAYDLLVSLGSELPAYDDATPWLGREIVMLDRATAAEVPVLGICFGGQLLARTLGGEVFKAEQSEIGWLDVRTERPDLVVGGPWFQWHFDTFTLPAGATLLADSAVGPQAFVAGRSLGVQFHPEVTTSIMEEWVQVYRHELDGDGVDPDLLMAETHRLEEAAEAASLRLLDGFLAEIAQIPSAAEAGE